MIPYTVHVRCAVRSSARVEDSLSEAMLAGGVKEGDSVKCVMRDGKVAYEKEGASPESADEKGEEKERFRGRRQRGKRC